jgi:hypothetical protein
MTHLTLRRLAVSLRTVLAASFALALAGTLSAATFVPISDRELYRRADVVVHGIVLSSDTIEGSDGQPETVSFIQPLRVWKGALPGNLVLRQAGGTLPDGRFFKLFGRPEYAAGDEVVVFAIALPDGDFQTAELLLGKFAVSQDASGRLFAVPALVTEDPEGIEILRAPVALPEPVRPGEQLSDANANANGAARPDRPAPAADAGWDPAPRALGAFLDFLDAGAGVPLARTEAAVGGLTPVVHREPRKGMLPRWGGLNNSLYRYTNGANEAWSFDGTANMTGGGTAQATAALATWTTDPNTNINYTASVSGANKIHLNAPTSSGCGWSTCITSSGGVIGCGGPNGLSGSNQWRGDNYGTINGGEVWLRCYATLNAFGTTITQSVLTHELGHTLGLGHSDQNVSTHETCRGDEGAAIMRSVAQNRTTLGTDDQDAIRWLYGDGLTSCADLPAPTAATFSPTTGTAAGNSTFTLTGTNFQQGATVKIGGTNASVTTVSATTITGKTPAHAVGTADVVVTNPDGKSAALSGVFFFDFLDVPPSYIFHNAVVRIFKSGITTGCGGNNYCPDVAVNRDQMSVFVLRGKHGSSYTPPSATGSVFDDVSVNTMFAAWMERFYAEGIIDPCDPSPLAYCPSVSVSRALMAELLLRAEHGSDYVPPQPTGVFSDVPVSDPYAGFIERLATEGITTGCGAGIYCPSRSNTRGEMAVFLVRTFNLP